MKELTEKQAIGIALRGWRSRAKTGSNKYVEEKCPLCDYTGQQSWERSCFFCPYHKKYGHCLDDKNPYSKWLYAQTPEDYQKYARQIVVQLEYLKYLREKAQ